MALKYKLEAFRDGTKPSQEGVFIHFLEDVPCYQSLITKEEYFGSCTDSEGAEKNDFITKLFEVEGVVEVSSKAYRLYIIKAELFDWTSIITNVFVDVLFEAFGETSAEELPGSRMTIGDANQRRQL